MRLAEVPCGTVLATWTTSDPALTRVSAASMTAASPDEESVRAVTDELERTGKYTTLSHDTLARTAAWAVERHRKPKDATKAARRKLHQVCAAFATERSLADARRLVAALDDHVEPADLRRTCRAVMRHHTSTAEREPFVEEFYAAAFDGLGAASTVVDLAAGLNPFAIPWMPLGPGTPYEATDIDQRFSALATALAPRLDVELTAGERDLVADLAPISADVVLLLKTLPTLEQQQRGSAARLLERIGARRVVVSFAAASLTGRRKGMPGTYEEALDALLERSPWTRSARIEFPSETLYHLARR